MTTTECAAEWQDDRSKEHYCNEDPGHTGGHECGCGARVPRWLLDAATGDLATARRRAWAAAYRDAAEGCSRMAGGTGRAAAQLLRLRADRIEAGELTPWAETATDRDVCGTCHSAIQRAATGGGWTHLGDGYDDCAGPHLAHPVSSPTEAPTSTESAQQAPAPTHGPRDAPRGSQGAGQQWRVGRSWGVTVVEETPGYPDRLAATAQTPADAQRIVAALNAATEDQANLAPGVDAPSEPRPDLAPAADGPDWNREAIRATIRDLDQLGLVGRARSNQLRSLLAHAEATDDALADARAEIAHLRREDVIGLLRRQRDAERDVAHDLRAELDRMRPVVDAAREWRTAWGTHGGYYQACLTLTAAVDRYDQQETTDG